MKYKDLDEMNILFYTISKIIQIFDFQVFHLSP
jgi:hypothetical protein